MNAGKIFRIWMSLIGILFCVAEGKSENNLVFEAEKIVASGIEMPYRVAHTNGMGSQVLVVYLHGGSSKGNDNDIQMKEAGIDSIANYLDFKQLNAVYLVPQCPSDKSWGGPMLGVLKALIDRHVRSESLDNTDIYIFGGSMGGTGTWSMLSAYPRLFTAAMPVAGNPSKCDADNVATTPIYTVMGTSDRIMSVETASGFIDELNARGAITRLDIEEGWTHEVTCIQSYTTERLDWIFGHSRNSSGIESSVADDKIVKSVQHFSIDGRRLSESPCKGFYIERLIYNDGTVVSFKILK